MRVLLADPPQLFLRGEGHTRQVQPLGLAYVGAAIADQADVRFLLPDTRAYVGEDPWRELVDTVVREQPDLIGLGAVTATYPAAARLAAEIKARLPKVPIVLGGVHASTLPEAALRGARAIDYVVAGEGEGAMAEIVAQLSENPGRSRADSAILPDPGAIPGLWWRDGETIRHAGRRPATTDLNTLRHPLRTGLVWPEDVQPAFYQAVVTLRGCPYKCIYCAVPGLDDARTRYRSPSDICDEIEALVRDHGIDYLFFHDSVFTLHRKRTLALCAELIRRDLRVPFCCQTRADRLDPVLLDALVEAGLHQVFFGIESGDPDSLARIKKAMPLATIREAVALVRSRGVRTSGFFMIGFPWEDEATMRRTAAFATSLDLDAVSLFSATPLPGTELWDLAGGARAPESIDFRTPQMNLTALTPAHYGALYTEIKAAMDAYNQERMLSGIEARTGTEARIDWMALP